MYGPRLPQAAGGHFYRFHLYGLPARQDAKNPPFVLPDFPVNRRCVVEGFLSLSAARELAHPWVSANEGKPDVLALFGRLHERASRVIDDAISEFARTVLADAFCVAEVASRTLGGVGEPPLRLPRLWVIEGGQPEQ